MTKLKIVSIVGARPQFIKYGPLGRKLKAGFDEILIHTGQHYDKNMSDLLFHDLNIPEPDYNLGVGSSSQGAQTAGMLQGIENILLEKKPDVVIVFGDTNSTLAGALAAAKLHIRLGHVEAGLRSFNKLMPEEINRVLTDHCSDLLFCPTQTAMDNLAEENVRDGVHFTGDIMYEAFLENIKIARERSRIAETLELEPEDYFLATIHRAENTDDIDNLKNILAAFNQLEKTVVFPVHPRTRKIIDQAGLQFDSRLKLIDPVGYLDMLALLDGCHKVLTDSGGLQKEAYFAGKYCKTLRGETEWVETLRTGHNVLCGPDTRKIVQEAARQETPFEEGHENYYGDGHTADAIISLLGKRRT